MKYIVKFTMVNGKEGQTQPFSNRTAAELAEIMMPVQFVKESHIVENPCDEAPYPSCNGANECDTCEHFETQPERL